MQGWKRRHGSGVRRAPNFFPSHECWVAPALRRDAGIFVRPECVGVCVEIRRNAKYSFHDISVMALLRSYHTTSRDCQRGSGSGTTLHRPMRRRPSRSLRTERTTLRARAVTCAGEAQGSIKVKPPLGFLSDFMDKRYSTFSIVVEDRKRMGGNQAMDQAKVQTGGCCRMNGVGAKAFRIWYGIKLV